MVSAESIKVLFKGTDFLPDINITLVPGAIFLSYSDLQSLLLKNKFY